MADYLLDPPDESCACDRCDDDGECHYQDKDMRERCDLYNGNNRRNDDVEAAVDAAEREREL